jgi:hypothetical protein
MGTPHLGADITAATRFLRDISNVITIRSVRRDLLKVLEPKSLELQDISQQFVHRTSGIRIVSMYEQNLIKKILVSCASFRTHPRANAVAQVVDQISATLGVPNERLFAIARDHLGICKYSEHDKSAYATVSGAVVELLEEILQLSGMLCSNQSRYIWFTLNKS